MDATTQETRFEDRMSDSDALMWFIEYDPALRSTIVTLSMLDVAPDRERLLAKVDQATRVLPRLRQRVAVNPLSIAPPRWVADPDFDLSFHVRFERLDEGATLRDLLDFAQPIAMEGLDRDRPLWQMRVVDGLEGGRAALVMKLHHSLSDGVGLVQMLSALVELEREGHDGPAELPDVPPFRVMSIAERMLDALGYERRKQVSRVRRAWSFVAEGLSEAVRDPLAGAKGVMRAVSSVGHLLRPVSSPLSPLMTKRSTRIRMDVTTVDFREFKRAARDAGGTINDAFVAATAAGLRRYHETHGATPSRLRMTMPINLRSEGEAGTGGNHFVPVRFEVPIGSPDPADAMRTIGRLAREERDEPALPVVDELAALFTSFPAAVSASILGSMLKGVDFLTSNVRGPSFPLYLAGGRILQMVGFGPLTGAAANLTMLSYDGTCSVGISTDPAAIPDPDFFVECVVRGFEEVLRCERAA
ncbi:MAG: wax ester/triacylglycerol synthase domain-containing protein [Alphaproteobacteria bacterium]